MKIAGLDIGTTGCKCTVFDENGQYLDKAYSAYPSKRVVGSHEIDVSIVMVAVMHVIRKMAAQYPDIRGIGVTSFGESFVATDEDGKPLRAAMLYTDPRGRKECEQLVNRLGEKTILNITGLRPHEMYSISKIMWLKANEPDIWAKTQYIFLLEDYVVYHLTGIRQIDYSLASRTMAFDIKNMAWSSEILEAAGIDRNLLSVPVPIGTSAGRVTDNVAIQTGLDPSTEIISVSHDQIAAAVGAGVFDSSLAVDGAGTVECLTPVFDDLPDMEAMADGYFSVVPYVIPGKYVAYAFSYTGGALMQWCTETVAKKEKQDSDVLGITVNELLEKLYYERNGENPSGLLVLPHFAGAATPYMDTGSKGAILGLTVDTKAEDIYRGCMEGIVYEMYLNAKALEKAGLQFKKIHATGGGAKSAVWMQMKADLLGVPIVALRTYDAGTVGCAMITGLAIGLFKSLQEASDCMVEEIACYEPRESMHEAFLTEYRRYEKVYEAVRPLMEEV